MDWVVFTRVGDELLPEWTISGVIEGAANAEQACECVERGNGGTFAALPVETFSFERQPA
jgi:hypothetical protein